MRWASGVVAALAMGCGGVEPRAFDRVAAPVEPAPITSVATSRSDGAPPIATAPAWNRRDAASSHLGRRVLTWMKDTPKVGNNFACAMTCHTAFPFAAMRLGEEGESPAAVALGADLETRVGSATDWADAKPFYGARGSRRAKESLATEAVLNAATLAMLECQRAAKTTACAASPTVERAFDAMWQMQRPDGGFDWLDFDLRPWEDGTDVFGAAVAARAASLLTASLLDRFAARIELLRKFSRKSGLSARTSLFIQASVLSSGLDRVATPDEREEKAALFASKQNEDGGFSWIGLGVQNEVDADARSDALPTAMAALALCTIDSATTLDAQSKAVAWLSAHQADDGSFPSRSPNRDRPFSHLVMTDAATAYASMALTQCSQ